MYSKSKKVFYLFLVVIKLIIIINLIINTALLVMVLYDINNYIISLIDNHITYKSSIDIKNITVVCLMLHISLNIIILLVLTQYINMKGYFCVYLLVLFFFFILVGVSNKFILFDMNLFTDYNNNIITMSVVEDTSTNIKTNSNITNTIKKVIVTVSIITFFIVLVSKSPYIESAKAIFTTGSEEIVATSAATNVISSYLNEKNTENDINNKIKTILTLIKKKINKGENEKDEYLIKKIKKSFDTLSDQKKTEILEVLNKKYQKLESTNQLFDWLESKKKIIKQIDKQLRRDLEMFSDKGTAETLEQMLSDYQSQLEKIVKEKNITMYAINIIQKQINSIEKANNILDREDFINTAIKFFINNTPEIRNLYTKEMSHTLIQELLYHNEFNFLNNNEYLKNPLLKEKLFKDFIEIFI